VTLRPARAADLDAILALERECFRSDRLTRVDLANALAHPRARLRVVAVRGGLVAYILLRLPATRPIARIESIGVAAAARGRGLAQRLVAGAERLARSAGAQRIRLEVRRSNRAARALYAKRGYRLLRELPRYYADGAHGLRLDKDL
jgi:ribosomal protein S18 acetylase RimI-like enzyme